MPDEPVLDPEEQLVTLSRYQGAVSRFSLTGTNFGNNPQVKIVGDDATWYTAENVFTILGEDEEPDILVVQIKCESVEPERLPLDFLGASTVLIHNGVADETPFELPTIYIDDVVVDEDRGNLFRKKLRVRKKSGRSHESVSGR